jgi:hypothetical protein
MVSRPLHPGNHFLGLPRLFAGCTFVLSIPLNLSVLGMSQPLRLQLLRVLAKIASNLFNDFVCLRSVNSFA